MSKRQLIKQAAMLGIKVVKAQNSKDAHAIGIHLLNPTVRELEDAVNTAERDLFPRIILHNSRTWPVAGRGAA